MSETILRTALEQMLREFDVDEFSSEGQMVVCHEARQALAALDSRAVDAGEVERVREAASAMLPKNVCLTNPNWADGTVVPLETTLGELRALSAALSTLSADAIRQGEGWQLVPTVMTPEMIEAWRSAPGLDCQAAYTAMLAATRASHASDGGKV